MFVGLWLAISGQWINEKTSYFESYILMIRANSAYIWNESKFHGSPLSCQPPPESLLYEWSRLSDLDHKFQFMPLGCQPKTECSYSFNTQNELFFAMLWGHWKWYLLISSVYWMRFVMENLVSDLRTLSSIHLMSFFFLLFFFSFRRKCRWQHSRNGIIE